MPERSNYKRLLAYLRPYVWPRFVVALLATILFSATNGAVPFLIRFIYDDIFENRDALKAHTVLKIDKVYIGK